MSSSAPSGAEESSHDREIARRRWRNMMIAAQASGAVDSSQHRRLETMRRELGIPIAEATTIAETYQREGGAITLFGDRKQRLEVLRDILTMMLIDGKIEDRESRLIVKLANKLEIDQEELDAHIEECRQAVAQSTSDSSNMSARIFRRMTKDSDRSDAAELNADYATADSTDRHRMQLSMLEELSEQPAVPPSPDYARENQERFDAVDEEDMVVARRLIGVGELVNQQVDPFRQRQVKDFKDRGRVVSFLTTMVKEGLIDAETVQAERIAYREETENVRNHPLRTYESEELTITTQIETLDQTFMVTLLTVTGQADHHSVSLLTQAFEEVTEQRGSAGRLILLDLSRADYISSAAIGAIIACRAKVLEKWGDVRFIGLSEEVEDVIHLLGVDSLIVSNNTMEEALWSFADFADITPE
ncbi:MAG: STAS domain-containing protein [Planctomycetota bacterium]|jgi:anti-anti-sigma factor